MRGFAAIVGNAPNIKLNTDIFIYDFIVMEAIIISNYNKVIFHTNIVITSSTMSAIANLFHQLPGEQVVN